MADMRAQKLNTVRFEAGGKLVQFKAAKVPRPKPAATTLFPVSAPKTFKVGIHAKANPGLLKAASAPGEKKFGLVPRAKRIGHDVLTPGTKCDTRLHRVAVKGAPRQVSLGVPRGKIQVKRHPWKALHRGPI